MPRNCQVLIKTENRFEKWDVTEGNDHDRKLSKTSEIEAFQVMVRPKVRRGGVCTVRSPGELMLVN